MVTLIKGSIRQGFATKESNHRISLSSHPLFITHHNGPIPVDGDCLPLCSFQAERFLWRRFIPSWPIPIEKLVVVFRLTFFLQFSTNSISARVKSLDFALYFCLYVCKSFVRSKMKSCFFFHACGVCLSSLRLPLSRGRCFLSRAGFANRLFPSLR